MMMQQQLLNSFGYTLDVNGNFLPTPVELKTSSYCRWLESSAGLEKMVCVYACENVISIGIESHGHDFEANV